MALVALAEGKRANGPLAVYEEGQRETLKTKA